MSFPGSSSSSSPLSVIVFRIIFVFGFSYLPYLVGSNNTSSLNTGSSTSCSFPFFLIFSTLTTLFCGYIFESDFNILYTTSSLGTSSIWAFGSGFSSTYFISSIGISSIISCFLPSLIITFFLVIFS